MAMTYSLPSFNLQVSLVSGTNATGITIAGIATEDKIVFVGHFTTAAAIATLADVTSHVTISAANTILPDTDYSSDQLMVVWVDVSV